jgi:hypothetical protein
MANNEIYNDMSGKFTPLDGNATSDIMALLGVADVIGASPTAVPTGKLHVTGNTLAGGNRRWSVGEWFSTRIGKVLEVYSRGNDIFGVRRLRATDDFRIKVEPPSADPLPPPGTLRRDPCCPLANPVALHSPYTHGDLYSTNGTSGQVYAYLGFDGQANTLINKAMARRHSHFSPRCVPCKHWTTPSFPPSTLLSPPGILLISNRPPGILPTTFPPQISFLKALDLLLLPPSDPPLPPRPSPLHPSPLPSPRSCFNYLSSPRRRNARRMEATIDKEKNLAICDVHERTAHACYWQTCDFSVVAVDALLPPPEAQFCEGAHVGEDAISRRHCQYITVLRHPIDRLYAAYSRECLACKEGGRQCASNQAVRPGLGLLTCPDMSIEAYARYSGNVYTRALSAKAPATSPDEDAIPGAPSPEAAAADRALRTMFVMLEGDFASEAPFAGLAEWMADSASSTLKALPMPPSNPFAEQRQVHPEVSDEVRQALADDIWLYQRALEGRGSASA